MRTIVACFTSAFAVFLLFLWATVDHVEEKIGAALDAFGMFLWTLGVILIITVVLLAGTVIALAWMKHVTRLRRPVDGAYPLQIYRLRRWDAALPWPLALLEWLRGEQLVVNINTMVASAAVIGPAGFREIEPDAGWDRQVLIRGAVEKTNQVRAAFPGDESRMDRWGAMSRPPNLGSTFRALQQKPKDVPLLPPPAAPADSLPLANGYERLTNALHERRGPALFLGQKGAEVAEWNPRNDPHLGIWGKSGSGKTTRMGLTVALGQIVQGYHVIVIDPEQNEDRPSGAWASLAPWAQVISPGEPGCTLWELIMRWYARRWETITARGATENYQLERPLRPLAIHFDEFARWRSQARAQGGAWAKYGAEVEDALSEIAQRGRKRGAHLTLYGQLPGELPEAIAGNLIGITFKQNANQGNKVGHWAAHQLGEGEFAYEGRVYHAFQPLSEVSGLLAHRPPQPYLLPPEAVRVSVREPVRETVHERGECVHPEVDTPPDERMNATNATNGLKWEAFTKDWLLANPDGGPSALARAMATAEGYIKDYTAYKGEAARMLDRCRNEDDAEMNEELAAAIIGADDIDHPRRAEAMQFLLQSDEV